MYIFVLQWPPAIKAAIQASKFGAGASIPFGTVFSCFMASCLLGSTAFGEALLPPTHHIIHLLQCYSIVQVIRSVNTITMSRKLHELCLIVFIPC